MALLIGGRVGPVFIGSSVGGGRRRSSTNPGILGALVALALVLLAVAGQVYA